jgi:hypothetical protein
MARTSLASACRRPRVRPAYDAGAADQARQLLPMRTTPAPLAIRLVAATVLTAGLLSTAHAQGTAAKAASAVQRGAEKVQGAVVRGVTAAASGVERGMQATARAVERTEDKLGLPRSTGPSASSPAAPAASSTAP